MTIEQAIYKLLTEDEELQRIFNGNIFPLSSKRQQLPCLYYQLFLVEVNDSKDKPSQLDQYLLKLHIFSEDFLEVAETRDHIRSMIDGMEVSDLSGELIIPYIRFSNYSNDYVENDEVFNCTMNFSFFSKN